MSKRMKAVFDCTADEPGEISFKEGDILVDVAESNEDGWYTGRIENTNIKGLFPYNYVAPLDTVPIATISPPPPATAVKSTTIISTATIKPTQKTSEDAISHSFPPLDAFEAAIGRTNSLKSTTNWTPLIPTKEMTKPPISATKPVNFTPPSPTTKTENIGLGIKLNTNSVFEKPKLKPVNDLLSPVRARSFSASAIPLTNSEQILKPSQIKGTKTALEMALSKGAPKPPSALRSNSLSKQTNNGIALVGMAKNPKSDLEEEDGFQILKPSQIRQKQTPLKPIPSHKSPLPALDTVPSSNPMPRLPSRPTSTASRKSRTHRTVPTENTPTEKSSAEKTLTDKASPEKPSSEKPSVEKTEKIPPAIKPKPAAAQPGLPPRPKARSSSNPPPKPLMSSIEILLSRTLQEKPPTKSLNELAKSKPVLPTRPSEPASPVEKKNPPPPPPSRPPKNRLSDVKHRYEVLFDRIQDEGYVDGETTQSIWVKSKLSNEDLARVWRECDPEHKGLLDKNAFIDGMTKIDDLLLIKQQ